MKPADIIYYFYSLKNPAAGIGVPQTNPAAIKHTYFDSSKETIILIHGGGGNSTGLLVTATRNAIVNAKIDMNIIGLDWYQVQLHNNYSQIYDCTTGFGQVVGSFLGTLIKSYGLKTSKLTIVGHSIAGAFCAAIIPHIGKVKHMVGLETGHIGTEHANYVQVNILNSRNYKGISLAVRINCQPHLAQNYLSKLDQKNLIMVGLQIVRKLKCLIKKL